MTDIMKLAYHACDCARQIGVIEAGRIYGSFTPDDSRFLTAMHQSKEKHVADLQSAIEALQKEVSTLDVLLEECKMDWSGDVTQLKAEHKHEIDALQAKLDAAAKQDAVAWSVTVGNDYKNCIEISHCESDVVAQYEESTSGGFESIYTLHKLYAAPKALAPLTEPERKKMWHDTFEAHSRWSAYEWFSHGIQRAEAAHGIGGAP